MSDIYQHFRPEEKEFIDQVIGWRQYVQDSYADKLTDFLDPREQLILGSIIGEKGDIRYTLFGGYENSERKRAIIYPEYLQMNQADFQISLYEIDYPKKFVTLNHRMVLGSLMSLGLTREKFGDIITNNDRFQFLVASEVEAFVIQQLEQVGKAKVALQKQDFDHILINEDQWHEVVTTVSSLRLDAIIGAAFNVSRQKAQALINQGHAHINWKTIERTSFECGENDILSVRGLGRCKIMEIFGVTKKEKIRLNLGLLK